MFSTLNQQNAEGEDVQLVPYSCTVLLGIENTVAVHVLD